MPGTTEPVHLFEGVSVGNDGLFWYSAANTTNTVVQVTSESVSYKVESADISYRVEAPS